MKTNKIVSIIFSSILCLYSVKLFSQTDKFSKNAQDYKTFFAVPDAPAFNLLNETPSNILKPSSVKELGIGISSFSNDNGSLTLPKAFAIEFSPGLLINGKNLTLNEYKNNKLLYRLRVSAASQRSNETGNATNFALGIRVTLNDQSDLRTDENYLKKITAIARKINNLYDAIGDSLGPTAQPEDIETLPGFVEKKEYFTKQIEEQIQKWSEKNWNADISELAFAIKTSSGDSLSKNLKFDQLAVWYSAAYGIGDWGQALVGANVNYGKDTTSSFKTSFNIISRLYIGTNAYKAFLEAQGTTKENEKSKWLLNSGFEIRIQEAIWAEFTAGIESSALKNSSLVTDFKLKYGL
jgi:hypothetical protein